MFTLPPALSALGQFRQFIVCRFVPRGNGKTDKFPVDWRTGAVASAHDPAIWLSWQEAAAMAVAWGDGHGVGFVLTEACGLWFLDIDACRVGDAWSPLAMELLARFNGAAVEVSHSGQGLHVIGSGVAPAHRSKNVTLGIELYTDKRFVALTGTSAMGDAATRHDAALAAVVAQYFPSDTGATAPEAWTTEPCAAWRGPTDDDDLIRRALQSRSAASTFGNRASFADLWHADADALARAYPDTQRGYDASSADSALAQHLAFWTGKNCERIRALMLRSFLVREKWNRDDYLTRTILGVVARQVDVLADAPPPPALPGQPDTGVPLGFLSIAQQQALFAGCVYVTGEHRVLVPGGYLLKPEQFRAAYGGRSFPMDPANERTVRNAWEAFSESQLYRSPRADATCFRPELPPAAVVEDAGSTAANLWWPIVTARMSGDPAPWLSHLAKLLPVESDRAALLAYLAAIVQYPGRKFQWAPLIQGTPGNGKTLIISAIAHCVGSRYTHLPNASDFTSGGLKFTKWIEGRLFVGIEEIYTADRRETVEALKTLVTNKRIEIQGKGENQRTGDNRANLVVCSNHKDAIPKTNDDRRWAIFYTAQQRVEDLARDGMDGDYFPRLYEWFDGDGAAIINDYLRNYAIPDALNPATRAHRAPETSSTGEAIGLGLGVVEQEIMEAIEQEQQGFAGGWVSSMALDKLLARIKADRRVPPRKRREMMLTLGYDLHPALRDGRVNNPVEPDAGRPKLYIRNGHISKGLETNAAVADSYRKAQNDALGKSGRFGIDGTVNKG